MGTGHTIDTPLRVAKWGISSVISLVDDILIEQVHRLHCLRRGIAFESTPPRDPKARALRITRYLDFMFDQVQIQMAELKAQSFESGSEKTLWFELLPDSSPLKAEYLALQGIEPGLAREAAEASLTAKMEPGSIDANIMTKLDRRRPLRDGTLPPPSRSDAKLALEGFANSRVPGNMVFSAGMNPSLFTFMEEFDCFYRKAGEEAEKGIIIKVTDFRSAFTQGKILAKKGLEVREFRIESCINCGGHTFASDGDLLGPIVESFVLQRETMRTELIRLMKAAYLKKGLDWSQAADSHQAAFTVQGGLGNAAEYGRMIDDFGMDATGWGSPFLLVPEATPVDERTRRILAKTKDGEIFMTDSSPLGVKLKNIDRSTAVVDRLRKFEEGTPGSACPKGYLANNTEFGGVELCTASKQYQSQKIAELGGLDSPEARKVAEKECICHQLGNGALEFLRQENAALLGKPAPEARNTPVSIIPGPNIAWFDRDYTLAEMINHIYGRIPSVVPEQRPHVFAAEIDMYLEIFKEQRSDSHPENLEAVRKLESFRQNLLANIGWVREWIAVRMPLEGENVQSIHEAIERAENLLGEVLEVHSY